MVSYPFLSNGGLSKVKGKVSINLLGLPRVITLTTAATILVTEDDLFLSPRFYVADFLCSPHMSRNIQYNNEQLKP